MHEREVELQKSSSTSCSLLCFAVSVLIRTRMVVLLYDKKSVTSNLVLVVMMVICGWEKLGGMDIF